MIYIDIYIHIYIRISIWKKAKLRPKGGRHSMGLSSEKAQAGREAGAFSGTAVLFVPGPVYL